MSSIDKHNAKALQHKHEEFERKKEIAPVGYHRYGAEGDSQIYEFVRTADGRYIEKTTTYYDRINGGRDSYTAYNGEVSFDNASGMPQEHFVADMRFPSESDPLPTYSGFDLDLKTGKATSYLTDEKPEIFTEVEKFFNLAKEQAIVDMQAMAPAPAEE
ncbi:MAG: hypothetical protein IJW32_05625 [Clostridia bacterium]|nr:hypothetical protein [Clostridia bacterium]